jgi:diadenosine tetraphosphate (Ap4A) HIT family hydrolase
MTLVRSPHMADGARAKASACRFCTLPEPWRIVLETPNFLVIMGLGPIVVGYCVLITKEHRSCYAELPAQHFGEFLQVVDAVQSCQRDGLGASLLFEHGRNGGCLPHGHDDELCYHAHVHLLPTTANLAESIRSDYSTEELSDWPSLAVRYASQGGSYLLVQDGENLAYVSNPEALPGRYLRTKAAKEILGDPILADWQAFPGYEMIHEGKVALEDRLRQSWQLKSFMTPR